jgi:hypothetical protein
LNNFFELYKELEPYKDNIEVLQEEPESVNSEMKIESTVIASDSEAIQGT